MSFIDQIAKIEKAKADIAAAEAKFAADRVAALAKLPADYGFDDINEFVKAVKDAYGKGSSKVKSGRKAKSSDVAKESKGGKGERGKRTKITDAIKAQVKALAEAGKTGSEIASSLGISAPSVQNIKKALGLVKARATTVETPAVAPEAPAEGSAPAATI